MPLFRVLILKASFNLLALNSSCLLADTPLLCSCTRGVYQKTYSFFDYCFAFRYEFTSSLSQYCLVSTFKRSMVEGEGEIPSWLLLIWMSLRWRWEVLEECDLAEFLGSPD